MLPKKRRIERKDFSYIMQKGKRFSSPHFLAYVTKSPMNIASQFSFSAPKKIFKTAVKRNKHRRWGYSAVRTLINSTNNNYLVFFQYKKASYPTSYNEVESEVKKLLTDSGVLL